MVIHFEYIKAQAIHFELSQRSTMNKTIKTELIENYLTQSGMTATKFCTLARINNATLKRLLKDDSTLRLAVIIRVAGVLGVHPCDLLEKLK